MSYFIHLNPTSECVCGRGPEPIHSAAEVISTALQSPRRGVLYPGFGGSRAVPVRGHVQTALLSMDTKRKPWSGQEGRGSADQSHSDRYIPSHSPKIPQALHHLSSASGDETTPRTYSSSLLLLQCLKKYSSIHNCQRSVDFRWH